MNSLKPKVLTCFKELHKVRRQVFAGDEHALQAMRQFIKQEFMKNKDVTDQQKIEELIKTGDEAREFARTHVVQLERQGDSEKFRMNIKPETHLGTNIMFDENFVPPPPRARSKRRKDLEKDNTPDCES